LPTQRSCPSQAAAALPGADEGRDRDRFTVGGTEAVARLRQTVREGNVLRIWIKDEDGRTLIEISSLLGVRGGVRMLPVWAAVDAMAAVSGKLLVEVKREAAWPSLTAPAQAQGAGYFSAPPGDSSSEALRSIGPASEGVRNR
jgi:hypothetical protein